MDNCRSWVNSGSCKRAKEPDFVPKQSMPSHKIPGPYVNFEVHLIVICYWSTVSAVLQFIYSKTTPTYVVPHQDYWALCSCGHISVSIYQVPSHIALRWGCVSASVNASWRHSGLISIKTWCWIAGSHAELSQWTTETTFSLAKSLFQRMTYSSRVFTELVTWPTPPEQRCWLCGDRTVSFLSDPKSSLIADSHYRKPYELTRAAGEWCSNILLDGPFEVAMGFLYALQVAQIIIVSDLWCWMLSLQHC